MPLNMLSSPAEETFATPFFASASHPAPPPPRFASPRSAQLWQELLDGHWRISQRIDSGGLRFVVGSADDGEHGLSQRERQVGELAGQGYSAKRIGYELALCAATVRLSLRALQRKLQLASSCELAGLFAPQGLRTRLWSTCIGGAVVVLGRYRAVGEQHAPKLTSAEQTVAQLWVTGMSSAAMAQYRRTSERTVENQIQAIYRKFGARSRNELATRLLD